jgi:hypothetical protein
MQPPTIQAGLPLCKYFAALTAISEQQNRQQLEPDTRHGSVYDLQAKVQAWVDAMTPTQRRPDWQAWWSRCPPPYRTGAQGLWISAPKGLDARGSQYPLLETGGMKSCPTLLINW